MPDDYSPRAVTIAPYPFGPNDPRLRGGTAKTAHVWSIPAILSRSPEPSPPFSDDALRAIAQAVHQHNTPRP